MGDKKDKKKKDKKDKKKKDKKDKKKKKEKNRKCKGNFDNPKSRKVFGKCQVKFLCRMKKNNVKWAASKYCSHCEHKKGFRRKICMGRRYLWLKAQMVKRRAMKKVKVLKGNLS